MAGKIRLNVVCASREKRFLVIAESEWSLEILRQCIEDVFHRLYAPEHQIRIAGLQNEFHFDMPLDYKVCDALNDAGLIFAVEEEPDFSECIKNWNCKTRHGSSCTLEDFSESDSDTDLHKTKYSSLIKKKQSHNSRKIIKPVVSVAGSSSVNEDVTSSTNSVSQSVETPLTPQLVESICEETEVDIETIDTGEERQVPISSSCVTPNSTQTDKAQVKRPRKRGRKHQSQTKKVRTA